MASLQAFLDINYSMNSSTGPMCGFRARVNIVIPTTALGIERCYLKDGGMKDCVWECVHICMHSRNLPYIFHSYLARLAISIAEPVNHFPLEASIVALSLGGPITFFHCCYLHWLRITDFEIPGLQKSFKALCLSRL